MTIAFICGSLQAGCDGVGDYSRKLAAELIKQGSQVTAIALFEKDIADEILGVQEIDGVELPVLRIPSGWNQDKRFKRVKNYIASQNAEIISLQFVLYSFDSQGLPFTLSNWLKFAGTGRQWHIMFHELWVGINIHSSAKLKLRGWLQKKLIQRLIAKLKPNLIHTQSRAYQAQLQNLGFEAKLLPLFGNISITGHENNVGTAADSLVTNKEIRLVYFGFIYPGAPIQQFAREVADYSQQFNVPVSLTIIGRSGPRLASWVAEWGSVSIQLKVLGEQPVETISKVLANASHGISTTAIELSDKSGTIAAMREHGLPVICLSNPWSAGEYRPHEPSSGVHQYQHGCLEKFFNNKRDPPTFDHARRVALEFAQGLSGKY